MQFDAPIAVLMPRCAALLEALAASSLCAVIAKRGYPLMARWNDLSVLAARGR
jgi:hypothetical protein